MKKIRSFVLSLAFVFVAFSLYAQDMPVEAAKAYNEGNKFLKAGNYENAIKKYQEALQTSQDYRIYYQLGVAYKKQNKLPEAEEAFRKSVESNPEFSLGYNGLGGTYFIEGKYQESVEAFKKFAELTTKKSLKEKANDNIARAYVKLAEQSKKDGNYQKAIEQLQEAIKYSEFDAAYVLLANTYYENGDYEEAIKAADKVISMNSKLKGAAYYYKGLALKQKQDTEKAKEYFELAKKDPQYKKLAEYELKYMR